MIKSLTKNNCYLVNDKDTDDNLKNLLKTDSTLIIMLTNQFTGIIEHYYTIIYIVLTAIILSTINRIQNPKHVYVLKVK